MMDFEEREKMVSLLELQGFLDPIFAETDCIEKYVIAGGVIRDLLFGFDWKDVDVFIFPNKKKGYSYQNALNWVFSRFSDSIVHDSFKKYNWRYGYPKSDTQVDLLFEFEFNKHPIQVLCNRNVNSPQQLIDSFDLDICQFALEDGDILVGKEVDIKNVEKALHENGPANLLNADTSKERLEDFQNRFGCDIEDALDCLNNTDIWY